MHLPNEEQLALARTCAEAFDDHASFAHVQELVDRGASNDPAFWDVCKQLDLQVLGLSEADGGGATVMDLVTVATEAGRRLQPSPLVAHLGATWVLGRQAAESLSRLGLVGPIADGSCVMTWAVGLGPEDGHLSIAANDGVLELNGARAFVPDLNHATHVLVHAEFDGGGCLVLLDLERSGVSRAGMTTLDLCREYGRLTCTRVAIDESEIVSRDPAATRSLLNIGVALQCAESIASASTALVLTIEYLGQRVQFGQLIGAFQAVKHRVADMYAQRELGRVALAELAETLESDPIASSEAASIAKSIVGPAASSVVSQAVQLHGGIGFTWEYGLHLHLRRTKTNELLLGTPAWHNDRLVQCLLSATGISSRWVRWMDEVA